MVPRSAAPKAMWTIVVWAAIATICALLYLVSTPAQRGGVVTILLVGAGAMVVLFVINMVRFARHRRKFIEDNNEAIAALTRGDLKAADEIYWYWAENSKLPAMTALASHNLAWTLMRECELKQAIEIAADNDKNHRSALRAVGLFPTSAVDLALYHGLLGDLDGADKWFAEAEARAKELTTPTLPAMLGFARAVVDCRSGRADEAARMLEESWSEYEGVLMGETMRPLRVVRAFAIAATDPRNAGVAASLLDTARAAYPGEYAFLGARWPEMAAFLAAHQLD